MSATNRSDVRRSNDHYVSPDWTVRRFLEAYPAASDRLDGAATEGGTWLDPCAADGELISIARSIRPDIAMMGVEVRQSALAPLTAATGDHNLAAIGDFLALADLLPPKHFDLVLTNPPYSLAVPFIEKCLRVSKVVAMLLRINFFRGAGRHKLMGSLRPGMFVLPERPSFTGRGTDATEYAWFVFGDDSITGRWFMLEETSEEERGAWNKRARLIHAEEPTPNPWEVDLPHLKAA